MFPLIVPGRDDIYLSQIDVGRGDINLIGILKTWAEMSTDEFHETIQDNSPDLTGNLAFPTYHPTHMQHTMHIGHTCHHTIQRNGGH